MPMGGLGLPDALPELTELVGDYGAQWWILDPLNKHFSRNLDPDSKRDVAMVLGELAVVPTYVVCTREIGGSPPSAV
jgi:hypothetical protein